MRRLLTIILAIGTTVAVMAQTLNIEIGNVTYQIPASKAGKMVYTEGTSLTIMDKAYSLSDVNRMYVDESEVDDNTVCVVYSGTTAAVYVAGNIAEYVSPTVSGAHVSIVQSTEVSDDTCGEITYVLSGTSTDGQFLMTGSYKTTVELRGLTLTNPTGAAIDIRDGKRISLSVKNGTTNTLTDGTQSSQKGALYCKGHLELKGKGSLTVYGKAAHGIFAKEYLTLKNATVTIAEAVKDGINCNQYFLMESGSLTIKGVGDDGIQSSLDGTESTGETDNHDDEDTGNIYIEDGTLDFTTTSAGAKSLKSDGMVRVDGGTLTLAASGSIDTSDSTDPSYVSAIKGAKFVQNGGNITATVRGVAGRGVTADDIITNGGILSITNSATPQSVSNDVKSGKGLKGENIALNGGTISITVSGNAAKAIKAGSGTQTTSGGGGGGGGRPGGGGGPGGGGMGGGSTWTNVSGTYTQGLADGTGPTLTVNCTGSAYSSSSAKAIKAICAIYIYGGQTEVTTKSSGAEGLESKTLVSIEGGKHYFQCYDDCINSAGKIYFNGGVTVCYSNGNDAVDSNASTSGAITIGNGAVFAYSTKGAPEEGLDCDNNSYIQITGTGIGISAGAAQGGGSNSISNAKQGYYFCTNNISYTSGRYYTLADASGNNLVTYAFPASCSSSLALFTATGMVKGSKYNVKYSTNAPTDATTAWHGLYLGSSHVGTTSVISSFTAN